MSFWKKLFGIEESPLANEPASFVAAAEGGDLEKVKALLKADPDLVFARTSYPWDNGMTALHRAALHGHKDVARLLLASKADVNAKCNHGCTPLHDAASEGHRDVAELLLANGADVNARANNGYTPLHCAADKLRKDLVELLLADNAEVNTKDNDGHEPAATNRTNARRKPRAGRLGKGGAYALCAGCSAFRLTGHCT